MNLKRENRTQNGREARRSLISKENKENKDAVGNPEIEDPKRSSKLLSSRESQTELHAEKDEQDREDLRAFAYFIAPQIICLCQGFVSRGVLVV